MKSTVRLMKNLWCDEGGASAAEYAAILALVGAGIAGATIVLGGAVATSINDASTCISTDGVTCDSVRPGSGGNNPKAQGRSVGDQNHKHTGPPGQANKKK